MKRFLEGKAWLVLALLAPLSAIAHEGVTIREAGLELFMEPPMLVSGEPARLVVHLTTLEDHQPVRAGSLEMTLQPRDGDGLRVESISPRQPGIHVLEFTPATTGIHTMRFRVHLPDGMREIVLRATPVFTPEVAQRFRARGDEEEDHDHDDEIHFSKERQWRMAFSTVPARREAISARLNLSAIVEPVPGRLVEVVAPARGILRQVKAQAWLREGQAVRVGDRLAELVPVAAIDDLARLRAEHEAAEAHLRLAQAELARVRILAADGVVAERRLIEAEAEEVAARAARDTLRDRLAGARGDGATGEGLPLQATLDGIVVSAPVVPGQVVETGARIATLLDARRVWLRVRAPAQDVALLTDPQDLRVRKPGGRDWSTLGASTLVYRGQVLENGEQPLVFEIDNPGELTIGLPLIASLAVGKPELQVTIPGAALLDDDGIDIVIVQLGGESFERRAVRIGVRAAGRVAILDGLDDGERVVVDGAYAVLLAGRDAGGLDHGHAH